MAYNLDAFEVFVVSIPPVWRLLGLLGVVSVGGGIAGALVLASPGGGVPLAVGLAVGVFFLPSVVGGEAIHRIVPSYPRNWGLYLALVGCLLAAILLPVSIRLGGGTAAAWLPIGVAALNALEVLVVSTGLDRFVRDVAAAGIQPTGMAASMALLVPPFGRTEAALGAVAVLFGTGGCLWLASTFVEWLVDANVTEVDGLEITANLVQRTPLELELGSPAAPPVQAIAVQTAERSTMLAAPWIHPGILEGVGGGRLTRETIRGVNHEDTGFFLHVPCSHRSDAAEPNVHEQVLDGIEPVEGCGRVSRLFTRREEATTFHGRRYGDTTVVFVESDAYGDFEIGVFAPVIDPADTLVVDRHVRADGHDRTFVTADSDAAERLRAALSNFIEDLEDAPLSDYKAGHAVNLDFEDRGVSLFALVEVVDGQRTLLLGADQNEQPQTLVAVRDALDDEFDDVVLFTTDTHASVYGERFDPQPDRDRVESVVAEARNRVGDASAGLSVGRVTETRLLGPDYDRLIHTLNVGARVYIVLLGAMYLVLLGGLAVVF